MDDLLLATFGVICMALAALMLRVTLAIWADRNFRAFWEQRRKMIRTLMKKEGKMDWNQLEKADRADLYEAQAARIAELEGVLAEGLQLIKGTRWVWSGKRVVICFAAKPAPPCGRKQEGVMSDLAEMLRKGELGEYDLLDALRRNPTRIQAGADICAEAADTIEAQAAEIERLRERIAELEGAQFVWDTRPHPGKSTVAVYARDAALKAALEAAQARIAELEAGLEDAAKSLDAWEPDPKPCFHRIRALMKKEWE